MLNYIWGHLKNMEDKNILYIYTGNHRVHRGFANTITKNIVKSSWILPRNYGIYFNEGEFFKPIILRMFGFIPRKSKIIALFSDPRLFYFDKGIKFNIKKQKLEKYPKIRWFLFKFLLKKLDGAICSGEFQKSLLKKYFNGPIRVVWPFISKEKYIKLKRIKPTLNEKNILFITTGDDYYCKGFDFLVDIFDSLKKEFPRLTLFVLGDFKVNEKWRKKGVCFEGFRNVEDYFKKSSLTVHFGRGEGFGVNILESLLAGVPTMVSKYTGAKEVVEKINPHLVIPLNKDIVINKIKEYFYLNKKDRYILSRKGKKIASLFSEERILKQFPEEFRKLIKAIHNT